MPRFSGDKAKAPALGELAGNERGIALIVVMVMLLLLSILGATVLTSTTTDLRITGNYKNAGNAFYVAESAMEFAQASSLIYSTLLPSAAAVWPATQPDGTPGGVLINDNGTLSTTLNTDYPSYNQIRIYKDEDKTQLEGTANVKVNYISTGAVPAGLGTEVDSGLGGGTGFQANFYVISVIADGPNNNSHSEIESHIARIVPK